MSDAEEEDRVQKTIQGLNEDEINRSARKSYEQLSLSLIMITDQSCSLVEADISKGVFTSSITKTQNATTRNQCPTDLIPTSLKYVRYNGSKMLTTIIARSYAPSYYEYHPSGNTTCRTARHEEEERLKDKQERKLRSEYIYSKINADIQLMKQKYPDRLEVDDEGINVNTFSSEASIRDIQRMKLDKEQKFRKEIVSRLDKYRPCIRNIMPIYNFRIIDGKRSAHILIAMKDMKDIDIFNEGHLISLTNVCRSIERNGVIQFSENPRSDYELLATEVPHPRRAFTPLTEIAIKENFRPYFGEFDTVGIVYMTEFIKIKGNTVEVVYLAYPDPPTLSSTYLAIIFSPNRTFHGYKNIITVGALISCTDLNLYQGTSFDIPTAYYSKETEFSLTPRHDHLRVAMKDLNERMKKILYDRLSYRFHIGNYQNTGHFKKTGLKYLPRITPILG